MSSEENNAEKSFGGLQNSSRHCCTSLMLPQPDVLQRPSFCTLTSYIQSAFVWNKLITRSIPDGMNTDITEELMYELVPKVTYLAGILLMMQETNSPQLELNLLHTKCTRFPAYDINTNWALWLPLGNCLQCVTHPGMGC